MKTRTLPFLVLLAALPVVGCVSLGPKVPPQLLRLTAAAPARAGAAVPLGGGAAVTVIYPTAPNELANTRVPVRSGATELAYVKDAQWVDVPARLFRDLLAETITARTGRPTLTPRDALLSTGPALSGRLSAFGIDANASQATVIYDATLTQDGTAQTRRFEGHAPIGAITEANAGAAINAAANIVAAQVADWIGH